MWFSIQLCRLELEPSLHSFGEKLIQIRSLDVKASQHGGRICMCLITLMALHVTSSNSPPCFSGGGEGVTVSSVPVATLLTPDVYEY